MMRFAIYQYLSLLFGKEETTRQPTVRVPYFGTVPATALQQKRTTANFVKAVSRRTLYDVAVQRDKVTMPAFSFLASSYIILFLPFAFCVVLP